MRQDDFTTAMTLAPELSAISDELSIYESLLFRWQRSINLIGRSTAASLWTRHFADSVQLVRVADSGKRWADLGSGAGFPGLVIALVQKVRGGGEMHVIESDSRKAAFLREVSRETGAGAIVHNARCEHVLGGIGPEVITSRAMTNLPKLIALAEPHIQNGGIGVFLKGQDVAAELTETTISSKFSLKVRPNEVEAGGQIVCIRAA